MEAHPALVVSTLSFLGVVALLILFRRDALLGLRQVGDEVEGTLRRLRAVGWLRPFRRNATPTLRDHGLDVGLDIFMPRGTQDDATEAELWSWGEQLNATDGRLIESTDHDDRQAFAGHVAPRLAEPGRKPVHVAVSPLLRRLAAEEREYEGTHRAPLDAPREATSSPLVHADTAVWDGAITEEFRRMVNLPAEVRVHREVLREEGDPTAAWARGLLFEAAR